MSDTWRRGTWCSSQFWASATISWGGHLQAGLRFREIRSDSRLSVRPACHAPRQRHNTRQVRCYYYLTQHVLWLSSRRGRPCSLGTSNLISLGRACWAAHSSPGPIADCSLALPKPADGFHVIGWAVASHQKATLQKQPETIGCPPGCPIACNSVVTSQCEGVE